MGRTGQMFGYMEAGIEPDVVCVAKGVASGLPLGVTVWKADERDWGPGSHASTFGGNPLSCVAALATIDLLESELMANAGRVGGFAEGGAAGHGARAGRPSDDVRGRGLMVGAEIVGPDGEKAAGAAQRQWWRPATAGAWSSWAAARTPSASVRRWC